MTSYTSEWCKQEVLLLLTGTNLGFQKGGAIIDIYICGKKADTSRVRSTLSMQSMLYLGGSGGMPPQENFANLVY